MVGKHFYTVRQMDSDQKVRGWYCKVGTHWWSDSTAVITNETSIYRKDTYLTLTQTWLSSLQGPNVCFFISMQLNVKAGVVGDWYIYCKSCKHTMCMWLQISQVRGPPAYQAVIPSLHLLTSWGQQLFQDYIREEMEFQPPALLSSTLPSICHTTGLSGRAVTNV